MVKLSNFWYVTLNLRKSPDQQHALDVVLC
jgi:hypothetical protein